MQHLANTSTARACIKQIPSGQIKLEGELSVPGDSTGVVLFAAAWFQRHLVANVNE